MRDVHEPPPTQIAPDAALSPQRAEIDFLRAVLAASGDCIKILDLDARLTYMSDAGMLAMEVDEFGAILGCPWPDFWHGQGNLDAVAAIRTAKAGGKGRFRGVAPTMKGRLTHWDVQVNPILGPDGRPERLLVVSRDVTELVLAEGAARAKDAYVHLLLQSTEEGFYAVDREGRTTMSNPAFLKMLGMQDEASIMGVKLHDVVHHSHPDGSHYPADDCPIYVCARDGIAAHVNGEFFWKLDGTAVPVEYWAHPVIEDGVLRGAICTFRDVSERAMAEAAIRESEARFRHMADSAPALIWMTDEAGGWSFANLHFSHVFNRMHTDFLTGAWRKVVLADDLDAFDATFADASGRRAAFDIDLRAVDRESSVRWLRCEGVPRYDDIGRYLGYTFCAVDQTAARMAAHDLEAKVSARTAELSSALDRLHAEILDRERAETLLRQSQKMEAVGQLTGGIAHDFNNLLTGITGSLSLLRTRVAQGRYDGLDRYLNAAQGASDRAAALTHRLLAFSRQQNLTSVAVDANALAAGLEDMVRRTAGPSIHVETSCAADLWTTLCDPHQLENALLNLCINARDAMPNGGRLTIETANARLEGVVASDRDMAPGDYVELRVSDTGVGMSPEVQTRVFEPFFTTKPLGQGTGLGLSMIYGFARQTGGQVRIHSAEGVGTTMRLYLPRFAGAAEPAAVADATPGLERSEAGETVLVVDDEETVRMLVSEALQDLGYRTLEAPHGPAGMVLLRSSARIDLLVTDVGMPGGMNGRQVADAGRVLRPGLKVLYMTGYAESVLMGSGEMESGMYLLAKPFTMEALAARIREIIEAP